MKRKYPNWEEAPYVKDFLSAYVSGLSATNTVPQYESVLPHWVEFLCERWNVEPNMIDYTTATRIVVTADHTYTQPIRTQVVLDFLDQMKAPTVRQVAHKVLHVYFGWIVTHGHLASNPVPKPDYGSGRRKKKQGLKVTEIQMLINKLHTAPIEVKMPLLIQFGAGLRVGEVCAIRLEDLKENSRGEWNLVVQREAMKGYSQGIVPLSNEIKPLVGQYLRWRRKLKALSQYLFLDSYGKPWKSNILNMYLQEIAHQVPGLRTVSTHDLRRAYATVMAENQVPADIGRQLLRQRDTQIGFGYVRTPHYQGEVRLEDVAKLKIVKLAVSISKQEEVSE